MQSLTGVEQRWYLPIAAPGLFTFDAANRIVTANVLGMGAVQYVFGDSATANPTPWVSYTYDTMANGSAMPSGLGRLTQAQSASAAESWGTPHESPSSRQQAMTSKRNEFSL